MKSDHRLDLDTPLHVHRWAAVLCLLTSLVGVGFSVHLTRIKFQMLYTPCLSAYGGCSIGGLTCDDALSSALSMLFGLPISVWGTGFYMTTAVAAALAFRRGTFRGTAAHLLFALAVFSALVSIMLAVYTWLALPSACPFCLTLYAVSGLLLGGAWLVWRSPGASHLSFAAMRRTRLADALDGLFALVVVLVVAIGAQSVGFHGLRNRVDAQDGCPEPAKSLPVSRIRIGANQPQAILALFVDMTCAKCRSEFRKLGMALQEGRFPVPVQLWIFHIPRQTCDPKAFPSGYDRAEDGPRFDNACMAARAAECMEKLQGGAGYSLMRGLFALHDAREINKPLFTAERIGNRAVDLNMEIDPDDPDNALFHCINHDKAVLDRITEHQLYADTPGFSTPTLMIFATVDGTPDLTRKPLVGNANTDEATIFDYVAIQAAPPQKR